MENNNENLPIATNIPFGIPAIGISAEEEEEIRNADVVIEVMDYDGSDNNIPVAMSEDEYISTLMNELYERVTHRQAEITERDQRMSCIYFAVCVFKFLGHCLLITFAILALTYTSHAKVHRLCPDSNAWVCVLLNGLCEIMGLYKTIDDSKYKKQLSCFDCFRITFSIGIYIWTQYEWFSIGCVKNLQGNLIYTMLEVDMLLGLIVICACIMLMIYCILSSYAERI